ncbi:MAG: KilA-N domain-containing protein [Sediminibacterium sp.]|uniref:KilA-N domain-containing protein n=1 Tax=Sediminibacterium sp. TaxID=1917865 RepID=UPI0025E512BE|nr:KilA-N domain-containing protein [Sediminibacterium sp.]MDO8997120.1 KilA-N domain-containing protein [Sediminibacterium sp.]MDP1972217.1 KilA-N domain-containing protein [Sediminibacterium sp.]
MSKNRKIQVKGVAITVSEKNSEDYISLTDMVSGFDGGNSLIEKWLRNKNTIEFLAVWENLHNPNFNSPEFEGIKTEAGLNRFTMSAKQWIQKTNAIGIVASAGRYGGTFAHTDIAFEFGSWLSPEFKLLLIKEFQRLKQDELGRQNLDWDLKRLLSKVNYRIHTDSIKDSIIPQLQTPKEKEWLVYAEEADLLNIAVFGMTAKQWKEGNAEMVLQGFNIRDVADLHQLTVLSNLESYNAILIKQGIPKQQRLIELHKTAVSQMQTLRSMSNFTLDKLKSPNVKNQLDKSDDTK